LIGPEGKGEQESQPLFFAAPLDKPLKN
jgi:hypothetical protein